MVGEYQKTPDRGFNSSSITLKVDKGLQPPAPNLEPDDTSLSSLTCAKENPKWPHKGGKTLNFPGGKKSGSTYLLCSYSRNGCLVKEEPKVSGKLHGVVKSYNNPKNYSDIFLYNTLPLVNGREIVRTKYDSNGNSIW